MSGINWRVANKRKSVSVTTACNGESQHNEKKNEKKRVAARI